MSVATLALAMMLPMQMELLVRTMQAFWAMTGLSRECKADGKSSNDTEIDYFHSFRFFLTLFTLIRGGVIARMYTHESLRFQLQQAVNIWSARTFSRSPKSNRASCANASVTAQDDSYTRVAR
jgi:hypothetical protein